MVSLLESRLLDLFGSITVLKTRRSNRGGQKGSFFPSSTRPYINRYGSSSFVANEDDRNGVIINPSRQRRRRHSSRGRACDVSGASGINGNFLYFPLLERAKKFSGERNNQSINRLFLQNFTSHSRNNVAHDVSGVRRKCKAEESPARLSDVWTRDIYRRTESKRWTVREEEEEQRSTCRRYDEIIAEGETTDEN